MSPTIWQKIRYLPHRLRFGLPAALVLSGLGWGLAPHVVTDGWVLWLWSLLPMAVVVGYGATQWGGSIYDCWPGVTVRCLPDGYVDDRTVIRSIEAWAGDPEALKGLTLVVEPGKPPPAPRRGAASAGQYFEQSNTLVVGSEALDRQSFMDAEFNKVRDQEAA